MAVAPGVTCRRSTPPPFLLACRGSEERIWVIGVFVMTVRCSRTRCRMSIRRRPARRRRVRCVIRMFFQRVARRRDWKEIYFLFMLHIQKRVRVGICYASNRAPPRSNQTAGVFNVPYQPRFVSDPYQPYLALNGNHNDRVASLIRRLVEVQSSNPATFANAGPKRRAQFR